MTTNLWRSGPLWIALLLLAPAAARAQEFPQFEAQSGQINEYGDDVEILTSGPVHEAFASVMQVDPAAGIFVSATPPELIEEVPPEVRPEGDAVWIPGYWAWDDDLDDFIWISGVWRVAPPGYAWIPGYWEEVDDGFQWITGYWASTAVEEVVYYPVPPESLEVGPSSPPPGEGYFWVPGQWVWRTARYVWQPGYWAIVEPGWVWMPAHYVWSPSGCIYVAGYWDYPVRRRGLLFAPVRFLHPVYARPGFRLVPRTLINTALLITHFFARPGYGHYYFGDYYAPTYYRRGIYPWYLYQNRGFGYDPLFSYYSSVYRGGYGAWGNVVRDRYRYFSSNRDFRPPRTFREQNLLVRRAGDVNITNINTIALGQSLEDAFNQPSDTGLRLRRIDQARQRQLAEVARESREFTRTRARLETRAGRQRNAERPEDFEPLRLRRPASPLAAAQGEATADGQQPRRSAAPPDRPGPRRAQRADRTAGRPDREAARAAEDADPFAGAEIQPPRDAGGRDLADPRRRADPDAARRDGRQSGRPPDISAADRDGRRPAARPADPRRTGGDDSARTGRLDDAARRAAARPRPGVTGRERRTDQLLPPDDRGSAARRAGERRPQPVQPGAQRLPGRPQPSELERPGQRIAPATRGPQPDRPDGIRGRPAERAPQPGSVRQPYGPRSARRLPAQQPIDPRGPAGVRSEQRTRPPSQRVESGRPRGLEPSSRPGMGAPSRAPGLPPQDRGIRGSGRPDRSIERPPPARRPSIESVRPGPSLDRPPTARRPGLESMRPPQRQAPGPARRDVGRPTLSRPAPAARSPAPADLRRGRGRGASSAEGRSERPARAESRGPASDDEKPPRDRRDRRGGD
ncbi:MAG: hypothetical protein WD847_08470 [Pirellulales bacterium]